MYLGEQSREEEKGTQEGGTSHREESEQPNPRTARTPSPPGRNEWPTRVITIDIETRSRIDLRSHGAWRYAKDPSTEVLTVVACLPDGEQVLWAPLLTQQQAARLPGSLEVHGGAACPAALVEAIRSGLPAVAHNAGFDSAIWLEVLHHRFGAPLPASWLCTLAMCSIEGLPRALGRAGRFLKLGGKDDAGEALIRTYCKPARDGAFTSFTPEAATQMLAYNQRDVELTADIYRSLAPIMPACELAVWQAHLAINQRGMEIDATLVRQVGAMASAVATDATEAVARDTTGAVTAADLTRVAFLKDWLTGRGYQIAKLNKEAIPLLLTEATKRADRPVLAVLNARVLISRASTKKGAALLRVAAADQIGRGMLSYWGAGTGRWTGSIVQPHNFPRPVKGIDVRAALAAIRAGGLDHLKHCGTAKSDGLPAPCDPMAALMSCLRSCLRARRGRRFVAFDYNAIECRGIFWLADEQQGLHLFRQSDSGKGAEIYKVSAARIFRVDAACVTDEQRPIGKEQILGCGYQMGPDTFAARCKQGGVDLAKAGVTAKQIVDAYRQQFPAVVRFWRKLQDASVAALRTERPVVVGRITFRFDRARDVLRVYLPSGRYIAYRAPRIVRDPKFDTLQMQYWDPTGRPSREEAEALRRAGKPVPKRGWWVRTYGGMLAENVCQAVCRDLLADALVRIEAAGLQVVLHVHDEIVVECDSGDVAKVEALLKKLMSTLPPWAAGFPIKVKGWTDRRFTKD